MMQGLGNLLNLSALGIYWHAVFVSITLGLPLVMMSLLYRYKKTGDETYLNATKVATAVLAINFTLGAITGTLVEFGLIGVWPGSLAVVASTALTPLALELIAFAMEVALLILFIVTLGRISVGKSMAVLGAYWAFALFSGLLITAVNSWLVVPWGAGAVPQVLYPFMPEFGELALDVQSLVALKVLLVASGESLQVVLQNEGVAKLMGELTSDPFVALKSPFAWVSIAHNLLAAVLVGSGIAMFAYAYRYYVTGDQRYLKILAAFILPFLIVMVIQPTIVGHEMGVMVAHYNPTKYAMIEGAREGKYNALKAFLAYGDPNRKILGFDDFRKECEKLGDITVGDVALSVGLTKEKLNDLARSAGLELDGRLDATLKTPVKALCLRDLQRAEQRLDRVHYSYYFKIGSAVSAVIGTVALTAVLVRIPVLSPLAESVIQRFFGGDKRKVVLALAALIAIGVATTSTLGWYVREVGRKPWTVYGLIYPEEIATAVDYASSAPFVAFAAAVIMAVNLAGVATMMYVATHYDEVSEAFRKIIESLRK